MWLYYVYQFLSTALQVYSLGLIVYIFMSWFPGSRDTSFGNFLARICEPYLEPFRKFIPTIGMIDFSPVVAILVLQLAGRGLHALFVMLLL
jgi:YggT family protein